MAARCNMELGAGTNRLKRRRTSRLLLIVPVSAAAFALIAFGAILAEFVADPSGLATHVPGWIVDTVDWATVGFAVWIGALIVVGFVLIHVQLRYGTLRALLALAVLMGVALLALSAGELPAYLQARGW